MDEFLESKELYNFFEDSNSLISVMKDMMETDENPMEFVNFLQFSGKVVDGDSLDDLTGAPIAWIDRLTARIYGDFDDIYIAKAAISFIAIRKLIKDYDASDIRYSLSPNFKSDIMMNSCLEVELLETAIFVNQDRKDIVEAMTEICEIIGQEYADWLKENLFNMDDVFVDEVLHDVSE